MPDRSASTWNVRKLALADVDATAVVLARAFVDNPTYVTMHRRSRNLDRSLERFFARNLLWRLSLGLTWAITDSDDRVVGTASLEPPGGVPRSVPRLLSHWVVPTLIEEGPDTFFRIAWADAQFARNYRSLAGGDHYWHVHAVAVRPGRQHGGAGTSLLWRVLEELSALQGERHRPVLLSTQRERNLNFYRRFGFELVSSTVFAGYRSWFMSRPPAG